MLRSARETLAEFPRPRSLPEADMTDSAAGERSRRHLQHRRISLGAGPRQALPQPFSRAAPRRNHRRAMRRRSEPRHDLRPGGQIIAGEKEFAALFRKFQRAGSLRLPRTDQRPPEARLVSHDAEAWLESTPTAIADAANLTANSSRPWSYEPTSLSCPKRALNICCTAWGSGCRRRSAVHSRLLAAEPRSQKGLKKTCAECPFVKKKPFLVRFTLRKAPYFSPPNPPG